MKKLYDKLVSKGWETHDIHRALNIIKYGKANQKNHFSLSHKSVYWTSLFVLIVINIILTLILVPFLVTIKHSAVYMLIILFSLGFGYIFNFLLADIEFEDPSHHVIAGIFIPAIALVNIYVIVNLTNYFIELTGFPQAQYNPIIITLIYVISFVVPYIYSRVPNVINKMIPQKNL